MNHYPSRVPSRISQTSESDLSLCEYITDPIIEKSLPLHYSDIDNPRTDSRVKDLEDTLLRSKKFVDKLTELANLSGSSDSDSDSEHLRESLRPHVQQYVRSMKTPVEMVHVELTVFHSSQSAGFGMSLSDGLLDGIYVNQIQPGGPAAQGGLLPCDKIIKVYTSEF